MRGYIGITARNWFMKIAEKENLKEINFWRKNINDFKVIKEGDYFFFLVKNEKGIKGERPVMGMATFKRYEVLSPYEAWIKYRRGNGYEDKQSFMAQIKTMYGINKDDHKIGCVILSDFYKFPEPVYLSETPISFKKSIVSGKSISDEELQVIIEDSSKLINESNEELSEFKDWDMYNEGLPEGKEVLKKHLVKERHRGLVSLAKNKFFKKHGKLFCEICGFDFAENYGDVGKGYIEAHHIKPLSEMHMNEKTRVEDLMMVCSNCHSMIHRKKPWLTGADIKKLLSDRGA